MKKLIILFITVLLLSSCTPAVKPGSDRDAHGCIGSAGYVWCAERGKCIRTWEEPCVAGKVINVCYECGKLGLVRVDFYEKGMGSMATPYGRYLLEQGISGSGARYLGKDVLLWDKGGKARLEIEGKKYDCTVTKDPDKK